MEMTASRSKLELFGKLAFALLVVAVFAEFLRADRIGGEPWRVPFVFSLAAAYATLGVLGPDRFCARGPRLLAGFYGVEIALANAIVFVTPLKGFSALVMMPVASMAMLNLSPGLATLIVVELFVASVAALWMDFGIRVALSVTPSYLAAFLFITVFSLVARQAESAKRRAEELSRQLGEANEQLRRRAAQAAELATTRERNRLAREIHDSVGHYLTTINVQLEAARAVFPADPARAAIAVEKAAALSRDVLDDVRRSVGALRADVSQAPLPEILQAFAQNLGLAATVRLEGLPRPLPPAVEHALVRAAQEGLTNVVRHAAARHTAITLDFRASGRVALTIADDGHGSPPGPPAGGNGLRGIRERIELLGGTVTAANGPAGGFVLQLVAPA